MFSTTMNNDCKAKLHDISYTETQVIKILHKLDYLIGADRQTDRLTDEIYFVVTFSKQGHTQFERRFTQTSHFAVSKNDTYSTKGVTPLQL